MRITSADPHAHPAIALNYLSTAEDRRVAADALKLTRRIVTGTQALKPYQPEELSAAIARLLQNGHAGEPDRAS